MQRWEYRSAVLVGVPKNLTKNKGWRVREIDEQELPDWKKSELHSSVLAFCNQMGQQGWELISLNDARDIALYFKRPPMDETVYDGQ
jgi:hypothetical protein